MTKLIQLPGARPADEGETLVVNYLKDHLPNTYTLIPNAEIIERGRPAFEYDLIVIAPHAVYTVEVKRWRGGIQGDDHTWVVAGQHRRPNPWPTANNKARVLKSQIQRRQPACDPLWVEAVVAIADDQGNLDLRGHCRERVFRYTDLPAFLTDASALGNKVNDLRPVRAYIEKAIQEAARGRTTASLRFGDYEVVEHLSRRDRVAEYLARNTLLRGEELVRLRIFSYDPYLEADDLARLQELVRREAESLRKIGPHPNLISLQSFATDRDDPNLFVEVTDWSEEGTLRVLMSAETPFSLERKLELAQGIAAGLKAAHDAGVIHRDVRPENILIGQDGQPRLMNFDHARLVLPNARTVSPIRHDPDVDRAYMAPELLDSTHQPTPATDIYGLGTILFEMLTGLTLHDGPQDALDHSTTLGKPAEYVPDIPEQLNDLIWRMILADPERRPQSADVVLDKIKSIRDKPSGTAVKVAPTVESEPVTKSEPKIEPAVFAIDNLIDGKYQVQRVLEAGGSGRVYQVYDGIFDQVYALKVFNDMNLSLNFLKQEARSLLAVSHPNIVRVHNWGRLAQTGRLYLVTDFVEGEELGKYITPDRRLPVREAVDAILNLLSALEELHPDVDRMEALRAKMQEGEITEEEYEEFGRLQDEGWLHRDVKPANLMLSPDGLMLVDFNIAAQASEASRTWVGTPGYMLPDVGIMPWDTDGDLFATGIVLYELVTGHHPYPNREPNAEDLSTDPRQYVPELSPGFAELLLQAVSCDSARRYHSARRFQQDLGDLGGIYLQSVGVSLSVEGLELEPWEQGKLNYNPYVTRFLTLYSQAQRDNSGTRGLDAVAQLTYVETRLDRLLRSAVLDGHYRLVIITGNAGDGKTAFIQNLEAVVKGEGGHIEQVTPNSSTFAYRGRRFVTNYDGSQDEGAERANDQVLTEFFAPFADTETEIFDVSKAARSDVSKATRSDKNPVSESVHLIAINEGRLIDFFDSPTGQLQFQRLSKIIDLFFDPDSEQRGLPGWIQIVDLNQRSVVARDPDVGDTSIFERQLEAFLKPEFWAFCQACALQDQCFIKFNVDTLADSVSGPAMRERLRTLFEIVHLRRQLHITMRDMRSALSWLLFRDHACDDVAQLLDGRLSPVAQLMLLYYNAYAADGQPPEGRGDDRLVHLLRQIDPAQVANPVTDRALHFQGLSGLQMLAFDDRSPLASRWLKEWQLPGGWEAAQQAHIAADHQTRHAIVRRIAFFERRDDIWAEMLPYQNLSRFQKVTQSPTTVALDELKQALVHGVSLAEGARHSQLAQQFVCLRAGQSTKASIKSFRLFSINDFKIQVPAAQGDHYLEYTPDRILFYHDPQDVEQRIAGARRAELIVSLDLLELLIQIRTGFTPSPDDIGGFFINLIMFKNALAHLPYRHVLLTRDDTQFYELALEENAVIILRPWPTERIVADETES